MKHIRILSLVSLLPLVSVLASVPALGAEIKRIEVKQISDAPSSVDRNLTGQKVSKFVGDALTFGQEVVDVYWVSDAGDVKSGSGLTLEYRRAYSDEIRSQTKSISMVSRSPRKTTFLLESSGDTRTDGPLLMWRARLVHEGKILAEKTSLNWR